MRVPIGLLALRQPCYNVNTTERHHSSPKQLSQLVQWNKKASVWDLEEQKELVSFLCSSASVFKLANRMIQPNLSGMSHISCSRNACDAKVA